MSRYINADKFLDKLLYMGYMDEQKSEIEEVVNRMIEEVYTKADMVAMLTDIQLEIEEVAKCPYEQCIGGECPFQDCMIHKGRVVGLLQDKIDKLKVESEVSDG